MRITYADGVFEELVELSFYIAEDDETAAQRFLNACDNSFRFLADNPLTGSIRQFQSQKLAAVRMWRVKDFEKYLIFYQPLPERIKILHILHSARDYNRIFDDE